MSRVGHGLVGVPDAGAFLARLTRLDPAAVVRLRPAAAAPDGSPRTALWARLPWQVLVTRAVRGRGPAEATVSAADLLAVLAAGEERLPPRRDADWRWPLPAGPGHVVETIGAAEVVSIARAAAGTLRSALGAHQVGERMVRDALLDHVAIVVTDASTETAAGAAADPGAGRVEVPQRLDQAVVRMGFLGASGGVTDEPVQIRIAGRWVALTAPYGTAWLRPVNEFFLRQFSNHTNG
jgi:hypothetical protein